MTTTNLSLAAEDALKYAAALLRARTEWTLDSIGGCDCHDPDGYGIDHEMEVHAIRDTVSEIRELASRYGDPRRYTNGRQVQTNAEIDRGLITSHVWHPDPSAEESQSWRAALPSDPGIPSPGIYEVTLEPASQAIHVRVMRTA